MKIRVISTQYQGWYLNCFWNPHTKTIEFSAPNCQFTFHTLFGYVNRCKTVKLAEHLKVEIHFRKIIKERIGIIMIKIKGVLLKAQAIDVKTGNKIKMSTISLQQLTR